MPRPKKVEVKRPNYTRGLTQEERRMNLEAKVARFLTWICDQNWTLEMVARQEGCNRKYVHQLVRNEPKYILTMRQRVSPARREVAERNTYVSKEVKELREQLIPIYFEWGYSDEAIGQALEMTPAQVDKWLFEKKLRKQKRGRKTNAEKGIKSKRSEASLQKLAQIRKTYREHYK